jgi:hypothetical protein
MKCSQVAASTKSTLAGFYAHPVDVVRHCGPQIGIWKITNAAEVNYPRRIATDMRRYQPACGS